MSETDPIYNIPEYNSKLSLATRRDANRLIKDQDFVDTLRRNAPFCTRFNLTQILQTRSIIIGQVAYHHRIALLALGAVPLMPFIVLRIGHIPKGSTISRWTNGVVVTYPCPNNKYHTISHHFIDDEYHKKLP